VVVIFPGEDRFQVRKAQLESLVQRAALVV